MDNILTTVIVLAVVGVVVFLSLTLNKKVYAMKKRFEAERNSQNG